MNAWFRSSVLFLVGVAGVAVACGDAETGGSACVSDGDCKGDRVCRQGSCEDVSSGGEDDDGGPGSTSGVGASGASTSATSATTGDGASSAQGSTASGDPAGPIFLTIGTNVTKLTSEWLSWDEQSNPTVTFTAVLTDPDGVDDLIGGTLKDASGAPYGAFVTTGQEGAYELTLSWIDINLVGPIGHPLSSAQERTFVAEFFDVAGHRAEHPVTLTLQCSTAACDGVCGKVECNGVCTGIAQACGSCDISCGNVNEYASCGLFDGAWRCGNENSAYTCHDGIDNDADGLTDCENDGSWNPCIMHCQ